MLHTGRSQVPRGPCAHRPTTESTSCWGRYTWAEALLPKHAGLRQPLQSRDTASGALRASLCPTWGPGGCRAVAGSPPFSAATHVMHTPTPSSRGWPSPALSDEEMKSAASVVYQALPQGCFQTALGQGHGTRTARHTSTAGGQSPGTIPGTSVFTLPIAARPKTVLFSFRIRDSSAQPAHVISRKTTTCDQTLLSRCVFPHIFICNIYVPLS